MVVSPDGLTAVYVGNVTPNAPYRATRPSRMLPFSNAQVLPGWGIPQPSINDLWMELGGNEMVVTRAIANGLGLFITTLGPTGWTVPLDAGGQANMVGYESSSPTVSADGHLAVFMRDDGQSSPLVGRNLYRIHELSRTAPVTPGTTFQTQGFIQLDNLTPKEDIVYPVLSPDGNLLFVGSTYPVYTNGQVGQLDHALKIYVSTRVGVVWSAPIHLTTFDAQNLQTAPLAITQDGCEFYFRRFKYPPSGSTGEIWVAKRGP